MPVKKEGKILSIQYLRGLAALGVVFCHYGSSLISYPKLSSFFNFGQTGVYVFFLISGFIIVYSLIQSGDRRFTFLLKRLIRISPAYYAAISLTILLFYVLHQIPSFGGPPSHFTWEQLFANVFYIIPFTNYQPYLSVFWTLFIEMQFYLLIGIFYFWSDSPVYKFVAVLAFSLSALIPFLNVPYKLVFAYAPIFTLGISLIPLYKTRRWKNIIAPAFLLLLTWFEFGLNIFVLLFLCCLVIFFFKKIIKPLYFLGNISYSLYLTHQLTFIVVAGTAKRLRFDESHYQLLWLTIEVSTAIFCAYIFYSLIEKPSYAYFMGLLKRIRLYSMSPAK
jgi:peptidoglycan/LPS O-acetylase OafA/YrhL